MGKAPIKKLILLSDIEGLKNSKWMNEYEEVLSKEFEVVKLCSLKLAGINPDQIKETIHEAFVNGGIDKASKALAEYNAQIYTVLGFSIGGVIAWRSGLNGLRMNTFYGVSSTRLRKESVKPIGELKLIYGELDPHKPTDDWYHKMETIPRILPGQTHDFYKESEFIKSFASQIIWASGIIY